MSSCVTSSDHHLIKNELFKKHVKFHLLFFLIGYSQKNESKNKIETKSSGFIYFIFINTVISPLFKCLCPLGFSFVVVFFSAE